MFSILSFSSALNVNTLNSIFCIQYLQATSFDFSLLYEGFEKYTVKSKKISNDQELIHSDPISGPQNQKGNN